MEQIKRDLNALCTAAGVGGISEITEVCRTLLNGLVDTIETDAMGNLLAVRHCENAKAPTLLLEAHIDEVGFLVTHIDDAGFVYVAAAGGADERTLTAQQVVVYGDHPYPGVFCSVPPHLVEDGSSVPELSSRGIDLGLPADEVKTHIPLGSRVSFAPDFASLHGSVVSSKALDNRAGVAAILRCLRKLDSKLPVHIAVALCVQEELGCRGSVPAANTLKPDGAVVVDVSFAATPDSVPHQCGKLSDGVMIGISPVLHSGMTTALQSLAEENGVAHQYEVMGGLTGTDADRISIALSGVPTALLSIPLRYMHTPVEVVDVQDVAATGDLMAAYIACGGACK